MLTLDTWFRDARFAWRGLMKAPGFAAVAVATLALGIGANTAIFAVVNAVVVRPLPYADPDRLVRVTADFTELNVPDVGLSPPELADYRDRSGVFSALAGVYPINANLTEIDVPERVEVLLVSPNYFDVLGVRPQAGRLFGADDNAPGIQEVVVISDALWKRRFAGSPDAIGRKLRIDNDWYTVVGVLPPGFRHPGRSLLTDVDLWAPTGFSAKPFPSPPIRVSYFLTGAIARLRPGLSIAEARQRLAAAGADFRARHPDDYPARAGWAPRLVPLQEDLVGQIKPALLLLLGAVGFVLLIACANIANLLLARASGRHRELSVRRALGATTPRLVRLLLTESVMLAVLGGIAAAGLAAWLVDVLIALVPANVPRLQEVSVDGRVVAFTAAVTLGTSLLFGLLPALQMTRTDVQEGLREGGRSSAGGRRGVRAALVIVEFALALVLLVGAGLLLRSFWRLQHVEIGFDPRNVLTARVWLPQPNDPATGKYFKHPARIALYEDVLRGARALPGVRAAAAATVLPLDGSRTNAAVTVEGRETDVPSSVSTVQVNVASTGYLELMGIRLVRGRTFAGQDDEHAARVVVITESTARRFWPGEDPVGRRIRLGRPQARNNPWLTVVGIVADIRNERLDVDPRPMVYMTLRQVSNLSLSIVVRTNGVSPKSLGDALAAAVRRADPDQPTYGIRTMEELIANAAASRRFALLLLGAFAALALLLAAVGIYGVMAFVVGQRTREIGIRVALGAMPGEVVRLVLREALMLAASAVVLGASSALILTRFLRGMLFEVRATDPWTYAAIAALLAATAAFASWRPAARASRVDPVVALRAE